MAASSEAALRKSREHRGRAPIAIRSDVATSWALCWTFHSRREGTNQAEMERVGSPVNQGCTALHASREKTCPERIEQSRRDSRAGNESEKSTRDWAPAAKATETPIWRANRSASRGVRFPMAEVIRCICVPPA